MGMVQERAETGERAGEGQEIIPSWATKYEGWAQGGALMSLVTSHTRRGCHRHVILMSHYIWQDVPTEKGRDLVERLTTTQCPLPVRLNSQLLVTGGNRLRGEGTTRLSDRLLWRQSVGRWWILWGYRAGVCSWWGRGITIWLHGTYKQLGCSSRG